MEYTPDIEILMPKIREVAKNAKVVIELGPATGRGSTIALLEGMGVGEGKLFISVDIRDYMKVKPDVDFWHLVIGDSTEKKTVEDVKKLLGEGKTADLIFIDTKHNYEHMKAELNNWWEVATLDTIWLFHDTWIFGKYNHMTEAVKEFAAEKGLLVYEDITRDSHGLGIMHK